MSIYGTTLDWNDHWPEPGSPPPILYRGSHILPSLDDKRAGSLDLGVINGHITRDGRDDGPEDGDGVWPFLRLSLAAPPDPSDNPGDLAGWAVFEDIYGRINVTVVLDADQVRQLRDKLDSWLARTTTEESGTINGE